jgi:hypothetical protein
VLFFIGWAFHPAVGGLGALVGLGLCILANRRLQKSGGIPVCVVSVLPDDWDGFEL